MTNGQAPTNLPASCLPKAPPAECSDETSSKPAAQQSTTSRFQLFSRSLLPATLLSFLLHLVLLLVLSLIVLRNRENLSINQLLVTESTESVAFVETPTFELQPELSIDEFEVEPTTDFSMPEVTAPQMDLPTETVAETLPEAIGEGDSSKESAEAMAGIPVARATIQERVSRAGGRKGEVQFALAWKNVNDIDLHVIAPSGERIWHLHKRSQDTGMLDVDMNVRGESTEPVENVRWISNAPWGRYTILVNLFRIHRGATRTSRKSDFQLLAKLGTESKIEEEDVSTRGDQIAVFRYFYVPQNVQVFERERMLAELRDLQDREELIAGPLLTRAKEQRNQGQRDQMLNNIVRRFPHTDAAIEAMQLMGGVVNKRGM